LCRSGFFVLLGTVQLKPLKRAPVLITAGVIACVWLLRLLNPEFLERVELMTYDMRVRAASRASPTVATNLGFVFIDETSVKTVWNGSLGYSFGLYWPRQIYARVANELTQQGAKAVAFDIIFAELRSDHAPVQMPDGSLPNSDQFFATTMKLTSNVVLAITKDVTPPALFLTNAAVIAHIATDDDADGVLRRAEAFRTYRRWHSAFYRAEADPGYGIDLSLARVETRAIVLPRLTGDEIRVPLDDNGNFDLTDFYGDKLPPGMARKARPFTEERAWHMGIALAARELGIDLSKAEVDLPHGRITLHGAGGIERVIPVDSQGFFYIDWCFPPGDPRLTKAPIQTLLYQNQLRAEGKTEGLTNLWRGKLAVIGSSDVVGNNLTDQGPTPLGKRSLLVSKHWNVANSVILGRFVHRSSLAMDLLLIALLGVASAFLTWQFRVLPGTILVFSLAFAYTAVAWDVYIQTRYWTPAVVPLAGAILTYIGILSWRVIFEQAENRRITAIFGNVLSKPILQMLLDSPTERLALGGKRREITVMFSDVRGFTAFTDQSHARVAEDIEKKKLTGTDAEARYDDNARETLDNINEYLGLVADIVIQHNATLDKFIGDCVMAVWGAPVANPRHAVDCVRAAIAAQRAIHALNTRHAEFNGQRELENAARVSAGLEPRRLLPLLQLGSGINTGMAVAGYMGSASETKSYTVFGGEVNLASRLEGLSGRGRIFISETTYAHLLRDDPELARTCVLQEPKTVKGISKPVTVYEVPWRDAETQPSSCISAEPPDRRPVPEKASA
jgi:adenylate cyclase